ncbi:MAG: 2-C-methyl-D-erythritol 2,4-cyclodiphosphate synthase [Candidatus Omnitrophica bacterium]|nr:2-C-methyl-D-erythritol 2,4-cyclodiphosphate synthase [Candidatus Omnitrophota bacterium]
MGDAKQARIGIGYDLHRLVSGRKLILGGVRIPYDKGLLGHSDADVLIHAIIDALLGASSQKDIGAHFPDSHPEYKDISSIKLLKKVARLLKKLNYSINNIDTIIVAEKPSLVRFKTEISERIAKELNLSLKQVNVKATTTEGLGPIGKGKAISAYAVCLIERK